MSTILIHLLHFSDKQIMSNSKKQAQFQNWLVPSKNTNQGKALYKL